MGRGEESDVIMKSNSNNLFADLFSIVDIYPPDNGVVDEWFVHSGEFILIGEKLARFQGTTEITSTANGMVCHIQEPGKLYRIT